MLKKPSHLKQALKAVAFVHLMDPNSNFFDSKLKNGGRCRDQGNISQLVKEPWITLLFSADFYFWK